MKVYQRLSLGFIAILSLAGCDKTERDHTSGDTKQTECSKDVFIEKGKSFKSEKTPLKATFTYEKIERIVTNDEVTDKKESSFSQEYAFIDGKWTLTSETDDHFNNASDITNRYIVTYAESLDKNNNNVFPNTEETYSINPFAIKTIFSYGGIVYPSSEGDLINCTSTTIEEWDENGYWTLTHDVTKGKVKEQPNIDYLEIIIITRISYEYEK